MSAFLKSTTLAIGLSICAGFAFGDCPKVNPKDDDKTAVKDLITSVNCLVDQLQAAKPTAPVSVDSFTVSSLHTVKQSYTGRVLAAIMSVPVNAGGFTLIVTAKNPQANSGNGALNLNGILTLGSDNTVTAQLSVVGGIGGGGESGTILVIYQP